MGKHYFKLFQMGKHYQFKALWSGVPLKTCLSRVPFKCRAALVCIACDIPAAHKLCGFKGHSCNHACSKCLKFLREMRTNPLIILVLTGQIGQREV